MGKQSKKNKKAAENQKINNLMLFLTGVGALTVVLVLVINVVTHSDFLNKSRKAFQVGEMSYTGEELDYYYYSVFHGILEGMAGYGGMMGINGAKSLEDQSCPFTETPMSWKEYILEQAKDRLAMISVEYQEALENGYTVDDVIQSNVDNALEYHQMLAAEGGYENLDAYLRVEYDGLREKTLRGLLEQEFLGQAYELEWENSYEIEEEELHTYYEEHLYEFNTYSYLYSYVGKNSQWTDSLKACESEQEFRDKTKELTGSDCYEILDAPGSDLGDQNAEDLVWISDASRRAGDIYAGRSGEDEYVLYFLDSSDNGFADGGEQWRIKARAGIKNERLEAWRTGLLEKYGYTER